MPKPKKVVVLGGNDTSYQLQLGLLARQGRFEVNLVHDSSYLYMPSKFYPDLLVGNLHIRDAAIENDKYFSSKVRYLRKPPASLEDCFVINTVTDAHNVSILHLPRGRRRYFTLQNADNVIMASAELTQYKGLIVYGGSVKAIAYACAAAKKGLKTWLATTVKELINTNFNQATHKIISQRLANLGVQIILPEQADLLAAENPALFTPNSTQNPGLMRVRQQLNHHYDHYPNADLTLQDGGDWYHLPLQATEQLINRIDPDESTASPTRLAYMWSNKPELPHKASIDDFAIHYAGELHSEHAQNCLTMTLAEQQTYRKVVLQDQRIVGFVLVGDVRGSERLADMMLTHQDIQGLRDQLLHIGY